MTTGAAATSCRRVLVANRGEIAVRVVRACRDLGIETVAVYSECDRAAAHVRMANFAEGIGPSPPGESYLRIDRLLEAARRAGADAVHPGYGFLSENAAFASACDAAGLTFIGPRAEVISRMGRKTTARALAADAGVAVVPGTDEALGPEVPAEDVAERALDIGYPVLVKAVAGGGGKGMRVVHEPAELAGALRAARSEAATAFGDSWVYLERYLPRPRHIEVQVLADHYGHVETFVERECSIQRRHQKVVEESPSPAVSPAIRGRLLEAARALARAAGYTNAGTVEFLLDADADAFYFLEMNTRLQVEHPITEMVTGVDLVAWQIRIARGEALDLGGRSGAFSGHAIECRVYAEDPAAGFLPSPGRIDGLRVPEGPGIRHDGWAEPGTVVPPDYDPMLAKLVAWGDDRSQAIDRMARALAEYEVRGIPTSVPFFRWLVRQPPFLKAHFDTHYLDDLLHEGLFQGLTEAGVSLAEVAAVSACLTEAMQAEVVSRPTRAARAREPFPTGRGGGWAALARREGLRG